MAEWLSAWDQPGVFEELRPDDEVDGPTLLSGRMALAPVVVRILHGTPKSQRVECGSNLS